MNKRNYSKEMENILYELKRQGKRPRLLLHACCAPCASYVTEYLKDYFDVTLYYYNPNIQPQAEYDLRLENLYKLAEYFGVKVLAEPYEPTPFFEAVKGLEQEKEGGARCKVCTALRLEKTAMKAKEQNFDMFCTSLSISPLKDAESLNEEGATFGAKYGVEFLVSDFKKKGGFLRSVALCNEIGIYRQNFCGCVYANKQNAEK